jgi:OFA family oxalate/formate antiporter-like MFS transporter
MLYVTYGGMGGIGTGIIYVGVIGLMVQWFPDKRGFACGMAAAGYGMGALATNAAISDSLQAHGYQDTLQIFGIGLGLVGLLAAQGIKRPPSMVATIADGVGSKKHADPKAMVKTPTRKPLCLASAP